MDDYKFPWGKLVLWVVVGAAALTILYLIGLGLGWAWLPVYKFQAKLNETQQAVNIETDAQRCINVNAQYQAMVAAFPAIQNGELPVASSAIASYEAGLPKDETQWSPQQQQMDGELRTDYIGLQQQYFQLQAQYNAFIARPDIKPCAGQLPLLTTLD